jgi:clan AA aspartic protease (TIGR02281 family)
MHQMPVRRAWIAGCLLAAAAGAASAVAAAAEGNPDQIYSGVYRQLGITLPQQAAQRPEVSSRLNELKRDPCNRKSVLDLAQALEKANYRREAAEGLYNFVKVCGGPDEALNRAADIFLKLPDHPKAVEVADEIVRRAPKSSYALYLRGTARDAAGDTERALADFANAIELHGNKRNIPAKVYLAMASAYAKLGRFCEAAEPIETWIALDPFNRDTGSTRKIVADYLERGKCPPTAALHTERFPLRGHLVTVQAEINGIRGNFVIDTGASYVALSSAFAGRARIRQGQVNQMPMATANGYTSATLSRADWVTIGKLQAKNVPVVVLNSAERGFGIGVDGLLGMSFLSRFDVRLTGGFIEIQTRRRP